MLPSGGVPRRTRTAVAPALLSSRAPRSAYAEKISTDEVALRLGLDLRAPTRTAGSLAQEVREFARGVDSALAPAPTNSAFWTPASGLRILREGLTTGAQTRELVSGRGGGGRTVRGAVSRGRSGPSYLVRSAEGDRSTTAPTRHARRRSVAGSPAGSVMSANVYSGTPTPAPGRRGTMRDAHGANEQCGAARRGAVYTKTRVPTRTPPIARRYPPRVGGRARALEWWTLASPWTRSCCPREVCSRACGSRRRSRSAICTPLPARVTIRTRMTRHEVANPHHAHSQRKLHFGPSTASTTRMAIWQPRTHPQGGTAGRDMRRSSACDTSCESPGRTPGRVPWRARVVPTASARHALVRRRARRQRGHEARQ
jgi:hypothetical protein